MPNRRTLLAHLLAAACTTTPMSPGDTDPATTSTDGTDTAGPGTEPTATGPTNTGPTNTTPPTTGETETETSTETDPGGCMSPADCTPELPACIDEVCASCGQATDGDAACADFDPGTPLCVDDTCIQCTDMDATACPDTSPICNAAGACTPCTFHFECQAQGSPACHIAEGSCFDAGEVSTYDLDTGPGLQTIIDDDIVPGTPHAVRLTGTATERVTIDNGRIVALLSADGQPATLAGSPGAQAVLTAEDNLTVVYTQRMRFTGNDADVGVRADTGARIYLDESEVIGNAGGGLELGTGTEAHLRNCFVGQADPEAVAIDVTGASLDMVYSIAASSTFMNEPALRCDGGSDVVVRNSVIATQGGNTGTELACDGDVTFSGTEGAVGGEGNQTMPAFMTTWFSDFNGGDYHLETGHPFADVAQWATGDPPFDIDGTDNRPTTNGAEDVAGADIP